MLKKLNMKSLMEKMFSKVENVVMDVTSGGLGISQSEDVFTLGEDESINSGALMSIPVPAFATKIQLGDINVGDILVHNGKAHGFVLKSAKSNKSLRVIQPSGVTSTMHVKNDLLTGSGWMIVKSMFGNLGSNSMLPMMMMMGDEDGDTNTEAMYPMLMMSMMQQNAGGEANVNPMQNMMLPMMMMSKSKGDSSMSDMLPMMMMMNGGMNFMQPKVNG